LRLYSGLSQDFITDSAHNQIAEKLKGAFFNYFRFQPSPGEISSWRNSLRAMAQVLDLAELYDNGVLLEYQLPQTSRRLDCLLCGKNQEDVDGAVIVELKQWERAEDSESEGLVRSRLGVCAAEASDFSEKMGPLRGLER
jgi:hypothetical protein